MDHLRTSVVSMALTTWEEAGGKSQKHPLKPVLRKCVGFLIMVNSDLGGTDHLGREQMALSNPGRGKITC